MNYYLILTILIMSRNLSNFASLELTNAEEIKGGCSFLPPPSCGCKSPKSSKSKKMKKCKSIKKPKSIKPPKGGCLNF